MNDEPNPPPSPPPYGVGPIRFAPYGEYADAFLFTAVDKLDGRSGSDGADKVGDRVVLPAGSVEPPMDEPVANDRLHVSRCMVCQSALS